VSQLHLRASAFGEPVRPVLSRSVGSVHSVFTRAFNVVVEGALVAVAPASAGRLPNGIALTEAPNFRALGLRVGDRVELAPTRVSLPRTGLVIDLRRAEPWDASLRVVGRAPDAERVRRFAALLPETGLGSPEADPWRAWSAVANLREGLAAGDVTRSASAAADLIGRGPGLTPAGDDLLVGCSAALTAAGHPGARSFARGAADAAQGRTSAVAETCHQHAARGEYGEHLHVVLAALAGEPTGGPAAADAELVSAVRRALAWGATSGADALLGVLVGLEASR